MILSQTRTLRLFGWVLFASMAGSASAEPPGRPLAEPWDFKEGDRIVLVGDTFIERDQRHGYLETVLTTENPDKNLTFRNLGWSGDTVAGLSRAGFDPPEAGYRQLVEQILATKPTVLVIGYGASDSYDGKEGRSRFVEGLNRLLDAVSASRARVVLLAPQKQEKHGDAQPDPTARNEMIELYTQAIMSVAVARNLSFQRLDQVEKSARLWVDGDRYTDNGVHLTRHGYWWLSTLSPWTVSPSASRSARLLGETRGAFPVKVELEEFRATWGTPTKVDNKLDEVSSTGRGVRFTVLDPWLPMPPPPPEAPATARERARPHRTLKVAGLTEGRYRLTIDGATVATGTSIDWMSGVHLDSGPEFDQVEQLRKAVNAKNLLFFHRWRPQNITYLFGFRKHEQGNNAIEVPRFDPLVEEKEREIARLRKPVVRKYELIRESEVAR